MFVPTGVLVTSAILTFVGGWAAHASSLHVRLANLARQLRSVADSRQIVNNLFAAGVVVLVELLLKAAAEMLAR